MSTRKASLAVLAGLALALPSAAVLAPASADDVTSSGLATLELAQENGIDGRYIVFLERGTRSTDQVADVTRSAAEDARSAGGNVVEVFEGLGGYVAELTADQLAEVRKDSRVEIVGQDTEITLPAFDEKDADEVAAVGSWGLDRINQPNLPLDDRYEAPGNQGRGAHVYVIDTGIASSSEYNGRLGRGYDAKDNDSDPDDCQGHGSHVSGTVGGRTVGVAPQATLHGVRVFGCDGKTKKSIVMKGMDWTAKNAQSPAVANMSLGGPKSADQNRAIDAMVDNGVTTAVAAGNEETNACDKSPASAPAAITVASTNQKDGMSWFSNYGRCVDLYAPGSDIRSVKHTGGYKTISGTSMATPHVAGVAALVLGENPNYSPRQVEQAIMRGTVRNKVGSTQGSPNLLLQTGFLGNGGGNPIDPDPTTTTDPGNPGNPGGNAFFNNDRQDIRDYGTVRSSVNSTYSSASRVKLSIDINHSCLENLGLAVTTPDGVRNVVKRSSYSWRCSAWRGTKSETYPLRSKSDGTWTLEVADERRGNTGTLNSWGVEF